MNSFGLSDLFKLPEDSFYVVVDGKIIKNWQNLTENDKFQVCPRVLGGKGGFSALLRSFRIYRSNNQDLCRDLSGRRVQDVAKEEKLKKWITKKAEREAEKERKRQEKYLRLKQGDPKHTFNDTEFSKTQDVILEKTDDAIEAGLQAALNGGAVKPAKTNDESKDGTEEDDPDTPGPSGSKKNDRKRPAKTEKELEGPPGVPVPLKKKKPDDEPKPEETNKEPEPEPVDKPTKERKPKNETPKFTGNFDPIDLESVESQDELMELDPEHLKYDLHRRGLKCGGIPKQRAERLWSVRGLKNEEIAKALKAK